MGRRLLIVLMLMCTAPAVYAQGCSLCTKTAAGLDDKSAKGLNGGILYLAALPLAIMGTVGFVWWKHNKNNKS
ncbi:MAG: hypothetical protein K8F30_04190 [Taibaiella sp.]|nr:hypothetical protein [Taibaiella sp.]